jgi:predicted O-linked N-acetylglucosamine transferase (SPINDLY family)
VGYVSPDFLLHSCSFFFEALLEHHDRSKVETICYSNAARGDAVTERLRRLADGWRDIAAMDDAAAARLIAREDRPDILVDLAGHTSGNRLALLARPLAPVAATWLGYPNTTGLPSIGYRLTDAVADPPGPADRLFTERLVRLDGGFLAYRPHPEMPEPAPRDPQAGPTVFGCFNNHLKISSGTIALWSAILAQVPESRLVLRSRPLGDPGVAAALRRRFEAAGVASDRLRILPYRATVRAGLEDYAAIDVALDPTPYNGTTTTCEALWMGVPVVTLAGDRHAARVGASILTHAGLADLVAATPADYVQIASSLAADRARLADDRRTLRPRMAASPVADGRRLAGGIEAFFADALSKASPDPG